IVVENLNIRNMVKNRKLSKSISDAGNVSKHACLQM
ncbi:putative transposase, partial [Bacillus sp. 491mf]